MTIPEKTFALWGASASAIALVPAAQFKYGGLYQNVTYPCVMFQRITGQRFRTFAEGAAGSIEFDLWQFSIHTTGDTAASSADTIRLKLIEVFDGNHGGFSYLYRGVQATIASQDQRYLLMPVDFLVSTA